MAIVEARGAASGNEERLTRVSPAPVTGWRRLAADMAAVGGSTLFCQGLGVINSLVLRAALDPTHMGIWQALKLLLSYANYANLGVSKGAARELAIAMGSGQIDRAKRGLNLAFTVNTLTSVVYGACLAGAAIWLGHGSSLLGNPWSLGMAALAVLVVVQRHVTFHVTILRCQQAFALTSLTSVVEGLLTLLVAGAAAWRWGLAGLYGGTLFTLLATLLFLHRRGVQGLAWDWQWDEIRRLVAIGGPILLGGVAATLLQSLDKLMILSFSADRAFDLGCYSTTLLITGQIYGLANMFAMVISPRYAELYGRNGSRRDVARLAARASELLAAATSLAAAAGMILAVPLLAHLFPDYRPGLLPAVWLVPGIVMLALALPLNQFLVAVCRERTALVATLVAVALATAGDCAALTLGYGIEGVAATTGLTYAGYYALLLGTSIWRWLAPADRRRYLLMHAGLLIAPLALAVWLTGREISPVEPINLTARLLAVVSIWGLSAFLAWRCGDWRMAWRAAPPVDFTPEY
ncbi:MAG TPA: oligosaccharide flippase family protein [Pirellulales bacterium]|nr:oligosaccharide flippase family protein [Pirellulales bacterium]